MPLRAEGYVVARLPRPPISSRRLVIWVIVSREGRTESAENPGVPPNSAIPPYPVGAYPDRSRFARPRLRAPGPVPVIPNLAGRKSPAPNAETGLPGFAGPAGPASQFQIPPSPPRLNSRLCVGFLIKGWFVLSAFARAFASRPGRAIIVFTPSGVYGRGSIHPASSIFLATVFFCV